MKNRQIKQLAERVEELERRLRNAERMNIFCVGCFVDLAKNPVTRFHLNRILQTYVDAIPGGEFRVDDEGEADDKG